MSFLSACVLAVALTALASPAAAAVGSQPEEARPAGISAMASAATVGSTVGAAFPPVQSLASLLRRSLPLEPPSGDGRLMPPLISRDERTGDLPTGTPFAGVADLQLRLPPHVVAVAFHEAGRSAIPLHPVGIPVVNDNLTSLASAPVTPGGVPYTIMRTRQRGTAATSSVDLAMRYGDPVASPVTGTVQTVDTFSLYGKSEDVLIEIVPDRRPDLKLVLMHVEGPAVEPGDRVEAAETVIAETTRQLPFVSQIESYTGPLPHIHMEFRPNSDWGHQGYDH